MLQSRFESRLAHLTQAASFAAWKQRTVTLRRIDAMQSRSKQRMRSEVLDAWFQQVSQAKASRQRVSAINQANDYYRRWKADRAKKSDENSRLPLSPPTEYYFIHDEPTSPYAKETVVDIKRATEEIIIQTQTFLSQRNLVRMSPERTSPPPFKWPASPPVNDAPSDDYFVAFEKKWALEEAKWRL